MAIIPLLETRATPPSTAPPQGYHVANAPYPMAIFLATASLLVLLLIIPPLCWHVRNRNVGLSFFIGWAMILLSFNTLNALLWDNDDLNSWYNGIGLCDVEVKLQSAAIVGFPVSFFCVLRGLAAVMNMNTAARSSRSSDRQAWIDVSLCLFFPLLQVPLAYIVQPARYIVVGIAGCMPSVDNSWLHVVIDYVMPGIWIVADTYLAVIILWRLFSYRKTLRSILASRQTSTSRFMRLYLVCVVWLIVSTASWGYEDWYNTTAGPIQSYSWSQDHNATTWNTFYKIPSEGEIFQDRWIWFSAGVLIFVFFGFGREAWRMYANYLVAVGFGRCVPRLYRDYAEEQRDSAGGSEDTGFRTRWLDRFHKLSSKSTSSSTSPDGTLVGSVSTPSPTSWKGKMVQSSHGGFCRNCSSPATDSAPSDQGLGTASLWRRFLRTATSRRRGPDLETGPSEVSNGCHCAERSESSTSPQVPTGKFQPDGQASSPKQEQEEIMGN